MPEQIKAFRETINKFPEVHLKSIDYDTALATLRYAPTSDLFRNANKTQVLERLSSQTHQLSSGLFQIKPVSDVPHSELQRLEFNIVGLDCQACSLGVHDMLANCVGVVHATASFRDRLAVAWVKPAITDRTKIEAILRERGVTLMNNADKPSP